MILLLIISVGLVRLHGAPEAPVGYHAPEGVVVGLLYHRPVLAGHGADIADLVEGVAVDGDSVRLPYLGVAARE